MRLLPLTGAVAVIAVAAALTYSNSTQEPPAPPPPAAADAGDTTLADVTLPASLSETAQIGQHAFDAVCAACHGPNAAGREGYGPPLVHRIYEPGHHADAAFFMAVQNGVQAHHWPFGNMPPQEGLTRADVAAIVTYVRELQHANGIN
jgi:mono/diheme cytochrome c family protein